MCSELPVEYFGRGKELLGSRRHSLGSGCAETNIKLKKNRGMEEKKRKEGGGGRQSVGKVILMLSRVSFGIGEGSEGEEI